MVERDRDPKDIDGEAAKVDLLASVIGHFSEDLDDRKLREWADALGEEHFEIVDRAFDLAVMRRELAERGLYLPDYSVRGLS